MMTRRWIPWIGGVVVIGCLVAQTLLLSRVMQTIRPLQETVFLLHTHVMLSRDVDLKMVHELAALRHVLARVSDGRCVSPVVPLGGRMTTDALEKTPSHR